mmetsp:Transcript_27542/g.92081  ORF Transcript_27542/g.92081 Transcript_27542/m.92081 type:complete len:205 (-) Transcript_27542:889-1503(-)
MTARAHHAANTRTALPETRTMEPAFAICTSAVCSSAWSSAVVNFGSQPVLSPRFSASELTSMPNPHASSGAASSRSAAAMTGDSLDVVLSGTPSCDLLGWITKRVRSSTRDMSTIKLGSSLMRRSAGDSAAAGTRRQEEPMPIIPLFTAARRAFCTPPSVTVDAGDDVGRGSGVAAEAPGCGPEQATEPPASCGTLEMAGPGAA